MSGKIVVAEYDYVGEDDNQLTFKEGDKILVIEEDDGGWWEGRLLSSNEVGFFPATYIKQDDNNIEEGDGYNNTTSNNAIEVISNSTESQIKNEEKQSVLQETNIKQQNNNNNNIKKNEGKNNNTMTQPIYQNPTGLKINENNMVNIEKIEYIGGADAETENYYSAEVLNLKFNPNAKSRFGLAAHYMSYSSCMCTIGLSFGAFSWKNGSVYISDNKIANVDHCLYIGLYSFFIGFALLFYEIIYGEERQARKVPFRTIGYLFVGVPMFITYVTALSGVLWVITAIFSGLAWKNGEIQEKKKTNFFGEKRQVSACDNIKKQFSMSYQCDKLKSWFKELKQQSQLKKYIFVFVFLIFNIVYVIERFAFYANVVKTGNQAAIDGAAFGAFDAATVAAVKNNNGNDKLFSYWFPVAKMFGNLLDINCAFILFPVCRSFIRVLYGISTDQTRKAQICNVLLTFMPLDKAIQWHKLMAFLIVVGTFFHTFAHFLNYSYVPYTYVAVFGPTVWISGALIIVCMHFMYATSMAAVRHGKFELFWYTHHLFVLFFVGILLHGRGTINPNFWKWFLFPGLLYTIERCLREYRSRKPVGVISVTHMNNKYAKIFCLELSKEYTPVSKHAEGQYVFIKSPIVSNYQWHPFTISSAPDSESLTLHIRNMGDGSWTDRLQQFFLAMSPHNKYSEFFHRDGYKLLPKTQDPLGRNLICIDGPMAAPTQHLGEYTTAIIVGAGIGVTPVRATLQSIIYYRFKRGIGQTFPDSAYCVWIVNYQQLDAYRFMCRTLKESEDELYDMRAKNKAQMDTKLIQIHIFVTRAPEYKNNHDYISKQDYDEMNEAMSTRDGDLGLWGTHYDELLDETQAHIQKKKSPFTELDIYRVLKNPPQKDNPTQLGDIIVHNGRPNWDKFFAPIKSQHASNKIGVMYCGPEIIAKDLKKNCGKYTDFNDNTIFVLHKENF